LQELRKRQLQYETESRKPRPNARALIRFNKQLHFAIYEAAGMPALLDLIERQWLLVGPIINFDLSQEGASLSERPGLQHHQRLVQALAGRDPVAAREALSADLISAADIIIASGQLPAA
jgi:DNA-binding GntR family transcriptional regulator